MKLTKKQFLSRKTKFLAHQINLGLLPEGSQVTLADTLRNFPAVTYYKNTEGVIRVGLSLKGIRKLVKRFPGITVEQVKQVFNIK